MLGAILLSILALPAPPQDDAKARWFFDFENGVPAEFEVRENARLTKQSGETIEGNASMLASFDGGSWHEFVHTKEAIRFEKGKSYHISYDCRVLALGPKEESEFYSMMRSRVGQGDIQGDHWRWRPLPGEQRTIHRYFDVDKDDCYFVLGVYNPGAFVVDNVLIEETTPMPLPDDFTVRKGKSKALTSLRERLDGLREKQRLDETMGDMLIIVCNEGAGMKAINQTDRLWKTLEVDFVDWNPVGPMAKKYGVRTSGGGPEYQEYYPVENEGLKADSLRGSGYMVSLNNTLIRYDEWIKGGMFTCHNGDNWHQWFMQETWRKAEKKGSICQDNIACAPWFKGGGCFCEPCQKKFQLYLRERYLQHQLKAFGIEDTKKFSIHDAILRHGLVGNDALKNPLLREYIKFQCWSQALAWGECVDYWKRQAMRQKRAYPVYGNQIGIGSMIPFSILLSQFNDVVEVEEIVGIKDAPDSKSMIYKMGLASVHHNRPVWVRGPVYDATKEKQPQLSTSYWGVHMSEALANGGVRDISVGLNTPGRTPETKDYIDDAELMKWFSDWARFVHSNRPLFTKRESAARVAIVYSLPSSLLRRFHPLRIESSGLLERHRGWGPQLEQWHVPYDCLVFGHPVMWDDDPTLNRLNEYDVLLFTNADAMTDEQIRKLESFQKKGGLIFSTSNLGTLDEDHNPRSNPPDFGKEARLPGKHLDPAKEKITAAAGIETPYPEKVQINLWRGQGRKSLDIHLVNFDIDVQGEKYNAVPAGTIKVALPTGVTSSTALFIRPFQQVETLKVRKRGKLAEIDVPSFDFYAVISITSRSRYDGEQRAADARRVKDREVVKYEAKLFDLH